MTSTEPERWNDAIFDLEDDVDRFASTHGLSQDDDVRKNANILTLADRLRIELARDEVQPGRGHLTGYVSVVDATSGMTCRFEMPTAPTRDALLGLLAGQLGIIDRRRTDRDEQTEVSHIPEITAERTNFRLEPLSPDGSRPAMLMTRRDPVEPVPVGTIVAMAFRVTGYDPDADGSLMARLEKIDASGDATGWEETHLGLYPNSNWVLAAPDTLDRLAGSAG